MTGIFKAACASEGASLAEILDSEMDAFVLAEAEKRAGMFLNNTMKL